MRFYLWGPSGTGKTWLFDAFIRKVNLIDDALSRQKPQPAFSLWIEDQLGLRQHRYTLNAEPTEDINYQEYTFHREYLLGNETDKAKLASTHVHQFMMMDGRGDETTGAVLEDSNTEENRARVLAAHEALKDADFLIVCVERGNRNLEPLDDQNVGQHFIQRLRDLLSLTRRSGQEIVICFTKSDRYGGKVAGFDAALGRLFGIHGREVGHLLRELNGTRQEPLHFFVSAVGYYHDPKTGKVSPNFVSGDNLLAQPDNWNPYNVEEPFFNILTNAEKKTINEMGVDSSGFWGRVTGKLMTDNLRKELRSAYVDYDAMLRPIKIRAR